MNKHKTTKKHPITYSLKSRRHSQTFRFIQEQKRKAKARKALQKVSTEAYLVDINKACIEQASLDNKTTPSSLTSENSKGVSA